MSDLSRDLWNMVVGRLCWGPGLRALSGVSTAAYDAVHRRDCGPRGSQAPVYVDNGTVFWRTGIVRGGQPCRRGQQGRGWCQAPDRVSIGRHRYDCGLETLTQLARSAEEIDLGTGDAIDPPIWWLARNRVEGIGHIRVSGPLSGRRLAPLVDVGVGKVTAPDAIVELVCERLRAAGIDATCKQLPPGTRVLVGSNHGVVRFSDGIRASQIL